MGATLSVSRPVDAASRRFFAMTDRDGAHDLSFWKLQALGWVSFYALEFIFRLPFEIRGRPLINTALAFGALFLGSCTMRPICRWLLDRAAPWMMFELRIFGASLLVGAFWRLVTILAIQQLDVHAMGIGTLQYSVVLFLWCNLYVSIKQWERLRRAETAARDARLAALRYQLNPHFLFNSLNVVSTLVSESNGPAATRMLAQISDYLRATLDTAVQLEVPLSDELAMTDRYLAIEQSRLDGRLSVEREIDPAAWDAAVPSCLLQPLVENAVRHGIAPLVGGGMLRIRCHVRDGSLHIAVRNCGQRGAPNARSGIGLANTAERLRALYGADYHFALEHLDSGGCEATVRIPFRNGTLLCAS